MSRYTDRQLETFLDGPAESDLVECKAMLKDSAPKAIRQAICAFANDLPPVKYEGRIWVRTGPRKGLASAQDERILIEKRQFNLLPFDIHLVTSSQIKDLSRLIFENEYLPAAFAPDILEANNRTFEQQLASCKMIASLGDPTPTVLGLLTLGKSPRDFLPGAYIQFLKIDGKELSDSVIDQAETGGTFLEMLRSINEKLMAHNIARMDIESAATHTAQKLYPYVALQQVAYNAVLHRAYQNTNAPVRVTWFQDRVEVSSPGGPYGSVTIENFGNPSVTDYRKPIFKLTSADGAIGSHAHAVRDGYSDFKALATSILARMQDAPSKLASAN